LDLLAFSDILIVLQMSSLEIDNHALRVNEAQDKPRGGGGGGGGDGDRW